MNNLNPTFPTGTTTPGAANAKIDATAAAAHRAADSASDSANAQVDRLTGTAHSAVDKAASATKSLASSASALSDQAMQLPGQLKESACATIRANPLATLAGALAVGYLVGRIARL